MKIVAALCFVLAIVMLFSALGMRPPEGSDKDFAARYMIGGFIPSVLFAVTGVWCARRAGKNARMKKA